MTDKMAGEAVTIVRRWANWIIDASADMESEDHDAGKRTVRRERDTILKALAAQASAGAQGEVVATRLEADAAYFADLNPSAEWKRTIKNLREAAKLIRATPAQPDTGAFNAADTNAFQFIIDTSAPATSATAMETLKQTVSIARARLDARLDARIAASAQPDTGDVAALREALEPIAGCLTAFPFDAEEGDAEEIDVTMTRGQIKHLCALAGLDPVTGAALSKPNAQGREG